MRASAGAVIPLLRGAPLGATAGRRGAGFFMATDCRTADGGDVVTADRTPRSAAASRRPCLDRSSPCWRRDKARQDEATRPGDKNRMWENKQPIFRSVWLLHCSCGFRNLCIRCCLCKLVFVSLGFVGVLKLINLLIPNHMICRTSWPRQN